MIALRIPADDDQPVELIEADSRHGLADFQSEIGGYIAAVHPTRKDRGALRGFCDEDGIARNLPQNWRASHLFGQVLVGTVIVVRNRGANDGSLSLADVQKAIAAFPAGSPTTA